MVKIEKLKSGSYRARVNLGGGKYKSITGKDKKKVQLEAAQFEANLKMGAEDRENPYKDMTVAEAMERYVESKKNVISPKTYCEYTQIRQNYFKEIHHVKLVALTHEQIQTAVNVEAVTHAPKTVRNMHGLLSSTLKMFRPEFVLHTTLPQKQKSTVIIPTEEDMIALLDETHGTPIELPIMLASICGLRLSEICGLKWSSVDVDKGTIRIENAKVYDIDNNLVEKGTKSVAGNRTLHIQDTIRASFERAARQGEYVTSLTPNAIYDRYQDALARCCPGKHYTFHELRHYACSVMIMLGIPNKYIADYLGHETEDMVNRVYGHIMQDKKDDMFDRVDLYYQNVFSKCKF